MQVLVFITKAPIFNDLWYFFCNFPHNCRDVFQEDWLTSTMDHYTGLSDIFFHILPPECSMSYEGLSQALASVTRLAKTILPDQFQIQTDVSYISFAVF